MSSQIEYVEAMRSVAGMLSKLQRVWWELSEEDSEILAQMEWGTVLPASLEETVLAWMTQIEAVRDAFSN